MDNKIDIPYISQYTDIQDKYLSLTSCGMVSFYMILLYFKNLNKVKVPQRLEQMITTGRETDGGYKQGIGWIHDYFILLAQKHSLNSYRKEKMESLDEIIESLKSNNPVIISVEQKCLSRIGLHMVVLTGLRTDDKTNEIEGFFYHDPATLVEEDGTHRYCSKESLISYWRKKAIFFSPQN